MRKLTFLLTCLFMVSLGLVNAQSKSISGKVISAEDGQPIIGATVMVKGTTTGTITGVSGEFSVAVPTNKNILVISFIGMETLEVEAKAGMVVQLKTFSSELDEIVVTAYGSSKKPSFTGSAAMIDKKKLSNRNVSNVTKALDGQVTGVMTTSGGGQPGDGASIRVRGYASINASASPLYVVDGIPFDGSLSSINPNDIESVSVLKDASAGALYGARGANGVVIITTKKGAYSQGTVDLKVTHGWSTRAIKPYKMVNQKEFAQLTYEALRNGYVFNNGYSWDAAGAQARAEIGTTLGGEIYNPFKNYTWSTLIDPSTEQVQADATSAWNEDWMKAVTNNNAPRSEYQLSFSGGKDKTTYLLSLGYLNEEGVLKNTNFERFSVRSNIDHQVKDWLKASLNTSASTSKQNFSMYDGTSNANVWYSAQFMAPIYPVYKKDATGANVLDSQGEKQLDYGITRPKLSNFSSIGTLYDDKSDVKNDNVSTRTAITLGSDDSKYGIFQGLKFNVNLGVDYRAQSIMYYYNMYHGNFASKGGVIEKRSTRLMSYTFNQLLTYNRTFGDHTFDVLAGHESYARQYNFLSGQKSGLVEGIYELAPATTVDDADSYQTDYKIESYLGRVNYNYKEKYYIDGSIRRDASSRFYKDNRWGTFWSVGGNWQVTKEDFMSGVDWVNLLAIRASYGVQGNDDILTSSGSSDYYLWQSFYSLTWPNAGLGGAVVSSLENKNITWEKNGNFNVGFESKLFNKRLSVELEYFNRKTSDLLLSYPMALSTGFSGYNANVGDIVNKGIEFSVGGDIFKTKDFTWNTTVMGGFVKNKVLKLTAESNQIVSGVRVIEVGKELNTYYMSKSAGVDPATGAQLYWVYDKDASGNKISDDYISSDYSKAANSKYYLGSRIPKLYGNINMDFKYKGFDLSVVTSYSIGGKIYESLYRGAMEIAYTGDTWSKNVLRRWQKPGDITDVPRVEFGGKYTVNDRYLIDASYLSIRNITLGYSVSSKLLNKAKIENLRVFMSGDNLYLFSHLDGMDPQYNFSGGTDYDYSPSRVISLGLNLRF
ncbi:MAG: TonB-dependent receptor plug [Bacteroidetes bacterium]|nr:TonB-dependent receptor plug [Bacteroidota bacterium]